MRLKGYNTKQRDVIYELLCKSKDKGLTSREIIELTNGKVGEATVYRQLSKMLGEGLIERQPTDVIGVSAYRLSDDKCGCRFHLHCVSCGRVVHMDCDEMKTAERHITQKHGFLPTEASTVINGICAECNSER